MQKNNQIPLLIAVMLLVVLGCKPDKLLPIDPCKEFNDGGGIGFKILENPAGDIEFETDTAYGNSNIIFQANTIYNRVEWKIAYDPRTFTNKRQVLRFTQLPTNLLPVTMIGYRKAYPECVVNDDGIDTVTKYFFLCSWEQSKLLGRYFGRRDSNIQDTSTITIYVNNHNPSAGELGKRPTLLNFPKMTCTNHPSLPGIGIGLTYKFFDVGMPFGANCWTPSNETMLYMKGFMPNNDSLIIDTEISVNGGASYRWEKWRGKKLP